MTQFLCFHPRYMDSADQKIQTRMLITGLFVKVSHWKHPQIPISGKMCKQVMGYSYNGK